MRDLESGVTVAALSGRIDIAGANEIDMPMNVLAGSKRAVVIDLTEVTFLASMGIRSIVLVAKAITRKQGACVVVAPPGVVLDVLEASGITTVVKTVPTLDEAVRAVTPG
jgi:anti-sigma B factor antagonist